MNSLTGRQAAYLDNAATSFPKPPAVVKAIRDSLDHSLTVARSTHRAEFRADDVLKHCRGSLARFMNASTPEEIIYTYSATDGLNMAINGLLEDGAHVLVSPLEHHSVMRPLHHLQRRGQASFSVLPADSLGYVDPGSIRSELRPETSCIICNWVSNVSGVEQPVEEIGRIAGELGLDFILDASQAAGTHLMDVARIGCTAMAMPGHKSLMSIPGCGVLFLRQGREMQPWRIGGTGFRSELLYQPDERPYRYESGTPNVAGIVGLNAAMAWFSETGQVEIGNHCRMLCGKLLAGLQEVNGLELVGPGMDRPRGYVLSFRIRDVDPGVFSEVLASEFGITTRPGLHCAPSAHEHYKTLQEGGTLRLSVGYFTTESDVEYCIQSISDAIAGFR